MYRLSWNWSAIARGDWDVPDGFAGLPYAHLARPMRTQSGTTAGFSGQSSIFI